MINYKSELYLLIFCIAFSTFSCAPINSAQQNSGETITAKKLKIDQPFLNIPLSVYENRQHDTVRVMIDGQPLFEEAMTFAENTPQWWSSVDLSPYLGKEISLMGLPNFVQKQVFFSNSPKENQPLYEEESRPKFHFSFRQGVLGDPTAKFYYAPAKEWHMFYIYNPFRGREIAWGHAVSKDLIHWEERTPIFSCGHYLYNGTGFVDVRNDLGLNTEEHQAIVLLQCQKFRPSGTFSYMISIDGGMTFQTGDELGLKLNRPDLPSNPLVEGWHDAPRIFWSQDQQRYVLYLKQGHRLVHQYFSTDLKKWEQVEDVPAIPESFTFEGDPGELVEMYLDDDPQKKYTVVMYGLHGYIVGNYTAKGMVNLEGKPISKEDMILTAHFGYPTIFHNALDQRVIMNQNLGNNGMGGIPNYEIDYFPDVSLPVELKLITTEKGPRLSFLPVKELAQLYGDKWKFQTLSLNNETFDLSNIEGHKLKISTKVAMGDASQFGIKIFGSTVIYDARKGMLAVDPWRGKISETTNRKTRSIQPDQGQLSFDIYVDATSLEVFANQGQVYIPHGRRAYYKNEHQGIHLFANGQVTIKELQVTKLNSIWENASAATL